MKVGDARAAAVDWVECHAAPRDGFRGAYFAGSTVGLGDDAELPASSDVDVVVVLAEPAPKPGKFGYRGALLEVTYLPWHLVASAEDVLASYHLAGSFRKDTIIADPTGRLRVVQAEVARRFAEPVWVRRRCAEARDRIEAHLRRIDPAAPWPAQVTAWLFGTGVTTHVILVAALRNPTVRLRYLAAREVLAEYGHADRYDELLDLLGCAGWTAERTQHHLDALTRTFDTTAAVASTPFLFSSDVTSQARPIVVEGGRELIRAGHHREAVFWLVVTFARCHQMLAADAPDLDRSLAPAFAAILADLGISSTTDLPARADAVRGYLPTLWRTAEAIRAAIPRSGRSERS